MIGGNRPPSAFASVPMGSRMQVLLEPLNYTFMLRGLAAAIIVGVVCAVVGSYVVLRGMAFLGDALAHAILPGVAVAYLIGGTGGPLFWGAMITAVLTALGVSAVSREGRIKEDTAIGVIFAGAFALGIAILSTLRSYSVDLTHILFGNILAVSTTDLGRILGFGLAVLLTIGLLYKELLAVTFDPVLAASLRLPAEALRMLLIVLVAVTVVVSLQTVGASLMVAMLVTPAAAARLLTRRLPAMMAAAAVFGALSGIAGLYVSFYWQIASGAAIALANTAFFLLAWLLSKRVGHGTLKTQTSP